MANDAGSPMCGVPLTKLFVVSVGTKVSISTIFYVPGVLRVTVHEGLVVIVDGEDAVFSALDCVSRCEWLGFVDVR